MKFHSMKLIHADSQKRVWQCKDCKIKWAHHRGLINSPDRPKWEDEPFSPSGEIPNCNVQARIDRLELEVKRLKEFQKPKEEQ